MTHDQRVDIAVQVNSGIPLVELATLYHTTNHSVYKISTERKRWLPESDIAKNPFDKRRYAQKAVFGDSLRIDGMPLSIDGRRRIRTRYIEPVMERLADGFRGDNVTDFLDSVFGIEYNRLEV